MNPRHATIAAALLALTLLTACANDKPTISGFNLAGTRFVSVGDTVTLTLPLSDEGRRVWRVSHYDSAFLALAERPTVVTDDDGSSSIVTKARALRPGETTIEVSEVPTRGGPEPRTVTFKVNIRR